jgi:hypothetical protein
MIKKHRQGRDDFERHAERAAEEIIKKPLPGNVLWTEENKGTCQGHKSDQRERLYTSERSFYAAEKNSRVPLGKVLHLH